MIRRFLAIVTSGCLALGGAAALLLDNASSTTLTPGAVASRTRPLTVGVAVHFGIGGEYGYRPGEAAEAIRSLGLHAYRDDLAWSEFMPAGADTAGAVPAKVAGFASATAARPLYILGQVHPKVAGGGLPTDKAAVAAFGRYATQAAASTGEANADFEIWNEWNKSPVAGRPAMTGEGDPGDPRSAADYSAIARAGVAAVRHAAPKARVLVGAAGDDRGWAWVSGIVRRHALDGADGLSVHLYNHCDHPSRRTGDNVIEHLEDLHAIALHDGWGQVPIWLTEAGWPTPRSNVCGVTLDTQADNLAQLLLWSAATPWVSGVWIYQLKDQGLRPNEIEDNFGLFDYRYRPKPAVCAVREAAALAGAALRSGVARPRLGVTMLTMTTADGQRLVAWSRSPAQLISTRGTPFAARPLCGASVRAVAVTLGARPTVINLSQVPGGVEGLRLQ